MKAPSFAYAKPRTLAEAHALLERPGAKALAGGQSLVPMLNMRLAAPEVLVDIAELPLKEISVEQGVVRIGALVTHAQIERSEEIAKHAPLLAAAVKHIGHAAIRNRGTLGGSIALADPAAEYPACLVALDATIIVAGRDGERLLRAEDFFRGLYDVDLKPGELVVAVEFVAQLKDERCVFLELARRHGDYAIIGLAAYKGATTRFVFLGAGATPVFAKGASRAATLEEAKRELERELTLAADLYNSAATKLHLAKVLLERAWNTFSTSR